MKMETFRVRIWPIILVAAVAALLTLLIPVPAQQEWLSFHLSAAIPVFNLGIFLPGVFLFFTALSSFKKGVRVAYGFVTFGLLLLSLGTIQYPVIAILNLGDSAWVTQGFTEFPFILGTFCVFLGLWLYTRLAGVAKAWLLLPVMIVGVLALMGLVTLLPHAPVNMPEGDLDLVLAFNAWEGSFLWAGTILLLLVKRRTSPTYMRAMAWLFIAFACEAFGCYLIITAIVTTGMETWFFGENVFLVPFIISGLSWLKSAEAFHNASAGVGVPLVGALDSDQRNFFGRVRGQVANRPLDCIDVVVFAASLCTDLTQVNRYLDVMRGITANRTTRQNLTPQEQEKLADVYLGIETYLIESDPVRHFTAQSLRRLTTERYQQLVEAPVFWKKVGVVSASAS